MSNSFAFFALVAGVLVAVAIQNSKPVYLDEPQAPLPNYGESAPPSSYPGSQQDWTP